MKKIILLFLLLCGIFVSAQIKLGTNPATIGASSLLELESANKALVISRVANTAAIITPVNGMIIYDNSSNCIKVYQNGAWSLCFGANASSNGTAVISSIECGGGVGDTFIVGVPVSGVSQMLSVNVVAIGNYAFSCNSNGITYTASGTFSATGTQSVTLTASGTPITAGSSSFTVNSSPSCTFTKDIYHVSTNGTAVVSAYTCSTNSAGTLTAGTAVSGVTQTLTANVTSAGTYSISTTINGVTFSGAGTFAGTGNQNVVLTATGTPTTSGTNTFTLNTTPNCSFTRTVGTGSSAICPTIVDTFPATVTIGGTSVTITAEVFTTVGTSTAPSQCGLSPTGTVTGLSGGSEYIIYTFSSPLKNVQIYSPNNDSASMDGLFVSAALNGDGLTIQSVPVAGGTCNSNFTFNSIGPGSLQINSGVTGQNAVVFTISSATAYNSISVTRIPFGAGQNSVGLLLCNATLGP